MKSLEDIKKGSGRLAPEETEKPAFADVPDVSLGAPEGMYQYLVVKGSAVAYLIAPWFLLLVATLVFGVFKTGFSPSNLGLGIFLALIAFAMGLYVILAAVGVHIYAKRSANRFRILFSGNRVTVREGGWQTDDLAFAVTDVTDMRHKSGFLVRMCSSSVVEVVSESRSGASTELMRLEGVTPNDPTAERFHTEVYRRRPGGKSETS